MGGQSGLCSSELTVRAAGCQHPDSAPARCVSGSPGQEKARSCHTAGLRLELTGFLMTCCKASCCLPLCLEGPGAA